MNEKQVLQELIQIADDLIKLSGWKELVSDMAIKLAIEKGYDGLKEFSPEIAQEFIEASIEFIEKDKLGLTDEVADLAAELFKKLVFKK